MPAIHDVPAGGGGDLISLGTVCGFPLEPGERVVFFLAPKHTKAKATLIVVGVLLTVIIFGIFLVIYGVLYERWALSFVALTNKRIIVRKGRAQPRFVRLDDVVDVRAQRPETGGAGAGLLGAAMSAAATMAAAAAKKETDKTDVRYWETAQAIVVQGKKGTLAIDSSADPSRLGPALAKALYTKGYLDQVPTVACPP
jgi:hypothetical protein